MRTLVILSLALFVSSAGAQELSVYVGGAIGQFDHDNESGGPFSDSVSAWKLYGGFQIGRYFSVEIGRSETSALEANPPAPLSIGLLRLENAQRAEYEVTTFRGLACLPLERLDLWASYGTFEADADVEFLFPGGGPRGTVSVGDRGGLVALGVDWKLGQLDQPLRVRLEYEQLQLEFSDAATLSIGMAYRFGDL